MSEKPPISGHTATTALIGFPTDHSKSPEMHNLSYELLGVDAVFTTYDVKEGQFADVIGALKGMGKMAGLNVTMPGKTEVTKCCDELSPEAEFMCAANIVEFRDGKAIGHNSDGKGFMEALKKKGFDVKGKTMTIIGPGGAGSAVYIQAAFDGMAKINVFARGGGRSFKVAEEHIQPLIDKTGCDVSLHVLEDTEDLRACIAASDLLVNATNVGMGEGNTDSPVPADCIKPGIFVADTIYSPLTTQLMKDAQAKGCPTMNGQGMLLEQAAVAERIWFNIEMPTEEIGMRIFGTDIYA